MSIFYYFKILKKNRVRSSIYLYKTEAFKAPIIFHVSIIYKNKINKTLNIVIMSNPISISSQNKPDNLQLLNNTRYKRKRHTLLSLCLSLLQTQTQPNKHCKTHTLLSLSLSLYPSPSQKPKRQSNLTDRLSWDIGTNQVSETKTIPLERRCNYFS